MVIDETFTEPTSKEESIVEITEDEANLEVRQERFTEESTSIGVG